MRFQQTVVRHLLGTFCLVATALTSHASTLEELLVPGARFQHGELLFQDFTYEKTGQMPAASEIFVDPLVELMGSIEGISIVGPFIDEVGGTDSTALITYLVEPIRSGFTLIGANLSANPTAPSGGVAAITETFFPVDPAILSVSATANLTDSSFLGPTLALDVQTRILLNAGTTPTRLSFVDQTYLVEPEPSSRALLLVGGLMSFAARGVRRRERRT